MGLKPYFCLATPRSMKHLNLPPDLAYFYMWNEGIGLECDESITVRICRLDEISYRSMSGLGYSTDAPRAWKDFYAIRIGVGTCGEDVTYVLNCPSAPPGSILAFGDHCIGWGGGGTGPDSMESSLVLAPTFDAWLTHMERWGWEDPILAGIGQWSGKEKQELRDYYLRYNENIDWPPE